MWVTCRLVYACAYAYVGESVWAMGMHAGVNMRPHDLSVSDHQAGMAWHDGLREMAGMA